MEDLKQGERAELTKEALERLSTPQHLRPENLRKLIPEEVEQLKQAISSKVDTLDSPSIPENDPRLQRDFTFAFSWKDGRGKIWKGDFTNRILSIRDRQLVGVMRAKLAAGIPVESLDGMTAEINLMVAHLSFSLTDKPKWAEDLSVLDDVRLLQEIYMEVVKHESTFLGYGQHQEAS